MLFGWTGYSVLITSLSLGTCDRGLLTTFMISIGCMILLHHNYFGDVAMIVPMLLVVLKFSTLCMVDGIASHLNRAVRPNTVLCSAGCHITTKSMTAILLILLSCLNNVNGRCIVPKGHTLCSLKPVSWPVAGLRPSFHLSRSK